MGNLKVNEPMAKHTSWRVGGPADRYYRPTDVQDLVAFLTTLPEAEPITWIGLGSNLLVRDAGVRGTVIATSGMLNAMSLRSVGVIRAEAGVSCAKVARFSARQGLLGAEFLAGIPGTVGGALAMNAGAFGGETWDIVQSVEVVQKQGKLLQRMPADYQIAYRSVQGPTQEWFVAAVFSLKSGDSRTALEKIRTLLNRRNETQPTQLPNAGSVFRNPPGDYSARLIEASGLKGYRMGGAEVSQKHANFIVNTGAATADDIERLIEFVQVTVQQKYGIGLIREVRIIGEAGS